MLLQQSLDYWYGKKSLWKAYWLIGVGGTLGFALLLSSVQDNKAFFLITFFAFIFFIVWSVVAIWRCAENASAPVWKYLARGMTVWGALGFFVGIGSHYFNTLEQGGASGIDPAKVIASKYENRKLADTQIAIRNDFYRKYPELDKPDIRPIVQHTAGMTAKELGKTKWDAELRDKTAERVKAIIAASDDISAKMKNIANK